MHECPECGFVCDCDLDDTWDEAPVGCRCECEDLFDPDEPPWEDEDDDDFNWTAALEPDAPSSESENPNA